MTTDNSYTHMRLVSPQAGTNVEGQGLFFEKKVEINFILFF